MSETPLPTDPLWPRAGSWLRPARTPGATDTAAEQADLGFLGVPAHRTSISPTGANATPAAVREALLRYSTYSAAHCTDVAELSALDFGDVEEPDGAQGEERVARAAGEAAARSRLLVVVGGDNSATFSAMRGVAGVDLTRWGLVTVDAHHDLRDGETNGSPVRRLIEAGLEGDSVVQLGIADFSNSPAYAQRARDYGITVITRDELRRRTPAEIVSRALEIAGRSGRNIYVDLDVDVCDRAFVPGCPAAAPGGISADELRQMAYLFARGSRVAAIDITEVDAMADAPDGRTVRLAALLVLEAAAGLASRAR